MKPSKKIWELPLLFLGVLMLVGIVYMEDSKNVEKAITMRAYLVKFCMENAHYPTKEELKKYFPKRAMDLVWFYRPAKDLKSATFEYMVTLPLSSAPGTLKLLEYVPVVDSYVITNPCQSFTSANQPQS